MKRLEFEKPSAQFGRQNVYGVPPVIEHVRTGDTLQL
jgi:hypothetical protein